MTVNDTTRTSEDDGQTETSLHQLLQSDEWRAVTLAAETLLRDSLNWYTMTQKTLETLHQLTTKLEGGPNILTVENVSSLHAMLTSLGRVDTVLRLQAENMTTAFPDAATTSAQEPCITSGKYPDIQHYVAKAREMTIEDFMPQLNLNDIPAATAASASVSEPRVTRTRPTMTAGSNPSLMIKVNDDGHKVNEDGEPKLRCELCDKGQKGPSALREHYSVTHFFEELFDKFVASNESHSLCSFDGCNNKDYIDRKRLVRHIGSTHNKIIEILEREGLQVPKTNNNKPALGSKK